MGTLPTRPASGGLMDKGFPQGIAGVALWGTSIIMSYSGGLDFVSGR
jgi:hypothetical protein